jgi:hypothetical protein
MLQVIEVGWLKTQAFHKQMLKIQAGLTQSYLVVKPHLR